MADHEIEVGNFEWEYATSRALTGDRNPRRPYVVGIRGMDASCRRCGARWHAPKSHEGGPGHFMPLMGGFDIQCPKCGHNEILENPPFPD